MKKTRLLLLGIFCILILVACNTEEGGTIAENKDVDLDNGNTVDMDTDDVVYEVDLPLTLKVPGKNIVIDYPIDYQQIDYGYTEVFTIHEEKMIAFTDARDNSAEELKEAHEIAWDEFELSMQNAEYKRVNITSEDYVTINGIDMYRYEGTMPFVHEGTPYDGYAVGYTFIMDEVPCTLVGTVLEYEQSPELIEEIETMVEAMIQTLRTER